MASLGPNNPGTTVDDTTVGTLVWTNPNNSQASDNVYASRINGTGGTTHYVKATNFGFSIPAGATINGIIVEVERNNNTDAITGAKDSTVKIVKADGTFGTENKADTVTAWPTTDAYKTYGSSSDLWSETWTAADINDVDFGMGISALLGNDGPETWTTQIDHIRITIYYTEGGASAQAGFMNLIGIGN